MNRAKVLVIDDMKTNIPVIRRALGEEHEVVSANNGAEGFDMAVRENPDLILLDIVMSGMDGYEVCQKLKRDNLTKDIPVIFLTGLDGSVNEEKGLSLGAIDYITKPFRESIVRARVWNHVELKKYKDEIALLSIQDGLTGLSNRRRFDEFLDQEWKRSLRNNNPISLILADVDFFKKFNDNYGHTAGDYCLKMVAKTFMNTFKRPSDLAARYGGEEFVAVLPDVGASGAEAVAHEILKNISSLNISHEFSEAGQHVTMSIGVASVTPEEGFGPGDLINLADEVLYKAKENGRNNVKCVGFS